MTISQSACYIAYKHKPHNNIFINLLTSLILANPSYKLYQLQPLALPVTCIFNSKYGFDVKLLVIKVNITLTCKQAPSEDGKQIQQA